MKVEDLMKKLNITEAEALELIESDKRIDKGEKLFELDAELAAGAKKARQAERKSATAVKREHKADNDKADLLNAMFTAVLPLCDSYEIINAEREFCIVYHGRKFKVTLSAPRS